MIRGHHSSSFRTSSFGQQWRFDISLLVLMNVHIIFLYIKVQMFGAGKILNVSLLKKKTKLFISFLFFLLTPNFWMVEYVFMLIKLIFRVNCFIVTCWLFLFIFFQLLGNMALWDGLIPEHVLKELMLERLLGRYLMITILNISDPKHTIQKCKKVHKVTSI